MPERGRDLVSRLLSAEVQAAEGVDTPDVSAFWARHQALAAEHADSADLAVAAGFAADRPAWAFASGYQAALAALLGGRVRGRSVALAVSEAGGTHPRAIATTVTARGDDVVLSGDKAFVTLGGFAEVLFVLASRGERADGRPDLVLVEVPADAQGVVVEALPVLPIVPEVPHGRARLTDVTLPRAALLPGDGYADYAKPFRTVEDVHVHGALAAWFLRVARDAGADATTIAELVAVVESARALSRLPPSSPATHLWLAGTLAQLRRLADDPRLFEHAAARHEERWARDHGLLDVAEKARASRLERAMLAISR